jgi:Transposase IS116/IS110/IS902 family
MAPVVEAFRAMRGVAFVAAVIVVAEVGDFTRFDNPRQLMAVSVWRPDGGSGDSRATEVKNGWPVRLGAHANLGSFRQNGINNKNYVDINRPHSLSNVITRLAVC